MESPSAEQLRSADIILMWLRDNMYLAGSGHDDYRAALNLTERLGIE